MQLQQGGLYTMLVTGIKENVGKWKDDFKHEISFLTDQGEIYKAIHMVPMMYEPDFQINKKVAFEVKTLGDPGKGRDLIRPVGSISYEVAPQPSRETGKAVPATLKFNRERIIEAQSAFRMATDIAIHEKTSTSVDAIRARAKDIMLNFHALAEEVDQILHENI